MPLPGPVLGYILFDPLHQNYVEFKPTSNSFNACTKIDLILSLVTQRPLFCSPLWVITLRPRQNGHHFADDTFNRIFLNEIEFSLKFVPLGPINNIPAWVQIMAWRRPRDKPLSEQMLVRSLTHICVIRPQWVKSMAWNNINTLIFWGLLWKQFFIGVWCIHKHIQIWISKLTCIFLYRSNLSP